MSEEIEVSEKSPVDNGKQTKKEEMVEFLTSNGKISEELAGSLYDEGLDNWKILIEGNEEQFRKFKGIGPAKAKIMVELGERKKMESEAPRPGLKEVLESIPRMNQRIISSLLESGYDSIDSFKGKTDSDLRGVKGIGPKMSEAILEAVKPHFETPLMGESGVHGAEEATAELVIEEEEARKDERSLIQRIVDAIGGFFGGKKKEEAGKPESPIEEGGEVKGVGPVEETTEEETCPEDESIFEEKTDETPSKEEQPEEGSSDEAREEADVPDPSVTKEEKMVEETNEVEDKASAVESPKEQKGFFERIKQVFFGPPKKEGSEEKTPSGDDKPSEDVKEEQEPETADKEEKSPDEAYETLKDEEPAPVDKMEFKEFEAIPGVSKKIADALRKAGYLSIDELKEAVPEDLMMIEGIGKKTADKICNSLKE